MTCRVCSTGLGNGKLSKVCSVNNMYIGCEYRYPEEVDDLSPIEERLVTLQAAFGYITNRSGSSHRAEYEPSTNDYLRVGYSEGFIPAMMSPRRPRGAQVRAVPIGHLAPIR